MECIVLQVKKKTNTAKILINVGQQAKKYNYKVVGFNYRMTDIQAALGLSQLSRIASFIEKRKKIVRRYHSKLKGLPICLPSKSYCDESSNHLFIIRIKNDISKLTHKKIFSKLRHSKF